MLARLERSSSVVIAPGEEAGYLVFEARSGRLHRLNPTASLILELADGTRDAEAIGSLVERLAGAGGREASAAWVAGALRDGLLVEGAAGPGLTTDALTRLVSRLRGEGSILAAYVCQREVTERLPEAVDAWVQRGELAHILGRREEARAAYERYLALVPGDAEVAHLLTALRDEVAPSRASDACITQLYARFASFYDSSMREDLGYDAPELLAGAIARALAEVGPSRRRSVLDLGCGTGLSGQRLRAFAGRLVGIDLSPEMLAKARARGVYDRLEKAEITAWLERDAAGEPPFDVIAACDSLIYFGDLRAVLAPAARRLATGGLVAFTVERGEIWPYRLTDSGRYAHHRDHLAEAAADAELAVLDVAEVVLRQEYGEPVIGLLAVLRRN